MCPYRVFTDQILKFKEIKLLKNLHGKKNTSFSDSDSINSIPTPNFPQTQSECCSTSFFIAIPPPTIRKKLKFSIKNNIYENLLLCAITTNESTKKLSGKWKLKNKWQKREFMSPEIQFNQQWKRCFPAFFILFNFNQIQDWIHRFFFFFLFYLWLLIEKTLTKKYQ